MSEARVDTLYRQIKSKAVDFTIRPGDRINEGALAKELAASRTPLREALNRLVAEHLLEARPGQGFYCRPLDAQSVFDLYELRHGLEVMAVRLACQRASDADLTALKDRHYHIDERTAGMTLREATDRDEQFHIDIAQLTGNAALVEQLHGINDRIRFIRWMDMAQRVKGTKAEHRAIIDACLQRKPKKAARSMSAHISRRMDQVVEAVREGISTIYMDEATAMPERMVKEV